ncbi:carbohydrate ABC transporter substrate-binding protein (CUT1 family) [Pseudogracilibacillus auburnensis]|uniref:Carbohydrate ABC transporter substrate-binding protein (CUT1 family) n=1 Tax=Pseudogracilibacillus auburnensis TaxID=1494959 RepID=A0A2V3VQP4_9BACI|nr:carbohydrate ABC transporter substrate-binding protein (CUT1 family) [Pseudogracilibacillus auburnensis]
MKKNLLLILSTMLIMFLAACGSSDSDSNASKKKDSGDKTEIDFYFPVAVGGPIANLVDDLVADFEEENPNIKVNPKFGGSYEETMTQVMAAVHGGNAPELAVLFSIDLFTLLENDVIEELTPLFDDEYFDDFYDAFMENSTTDDKVFSLPFQRSTIVLYYNKDAFKEAGLDPEKPPTNWNELVEYGKKLTIDEGKTQWGLEIPSTGYQYWMLQALALQTEENIMSKDGKEVYFDAPYVKESMDFWLDLGNVHKIMPEGVIEWATVPSDFLSGNTAMMFHTTGNLTNVKENADFEFGVSFLPANNQYGSPTGGGNIYLFKDIPEENRDAAIKFMEFLTGPERIAQWSIDTGYVATRESAYETETLKEYTEVFPESIVAREQLEYADSELATYQNGEIQKLFNDALQSILTGNTTVEDGLNDAQEEANRVLEPFQE